LDGNLLVEFVGAQTLMEVFWSVSVDEDRGSPLGEKRGRDEMDIMVTELKKRMRVRRLSPVELICTQLARLFVSEPTSPEWGPVRVVRPSLREPVLEFTDTDELLPPLLRCVLPRGMTRLFSPLPRHEPVRLDHTKLNYCHVARLFFELDSDHRDSLFTLLYADVDSGCVFPDELQLKPCAAVLLTTSDPVAVPAELYARLREAHVDAYPSARMQSLAFEEDVLSGDKFRDPYAKAVAMNVTARVTRVF